jgi:hypothetical protein
VTAKQKRPQDRNNPAGAFRIKDRFVVEAALAGGLGPRDREPENALTLSQAAVRRLASR